jgi:hypothetical protein
MRYAFTFLFFLVVAYLLVRQVYFHRPSVLEPVNALVQHGLLEPVQGMVPAVSRLVDWLPASRKYVPNPYGYGGLDPAGGERKGGNGRGIPDEVSVGWWNGEHSYPEKHLSPVQDSEEIPSAQVVNVGWWGDEWLA